MTAIRARVPHSGCCAWYYSCNRGPHTLGVVTEEGPAIDGLAEIAIEIAAETELSRDAAQAAIRIMEMVCPTEAGENSPAARTDSPPAVSG
jgi:hypothetical protein